MSLLLSAGQLWAMTNNAPDNAPDADALFLEDGFIRAIGKRQDLKATFSPRRDLHLSAGTILPAFHDTHTHFFELARKRAGIDLIGSVSAGEVLRRLRVAAPKLQSEPEWVGGGGWDRFLYSDVEELNLANLDAIFPNRPVVLQARDFHTLWCNSEALRRCGILDGREAPAGGRIGRDANGHPDGFLYETAWELVLAAVPPESPEVARRWILEAGRHAHSLGITALHCMEPETNYQHYRRLDAAGELPLRISFHSPLAQLEERIAEGNRPGYSGESARLREAGVKIFMDGSLGSRSASMSVPYSDGTHGGLLLEPVELKNILLRAGRAGISGSVHAIGDHCVEAVLEAFEWLAQELGSEAPGHPRIEHAQCVRPEHVERIAQAGIYCAMQPVHLIDDIPVFPKEWPIAGDWAYPIASLLRAGAKVGLGSDAPVATLDPRQGIFAACERREGLAPSGAVWGPQECIPAMKALELYTSMAAEGSAFAGEFGILRPGQRADIVVMGGVDAGDASSWLNAEVLCTLMDGELVYEAG